MYCKHCGAFNDDDTEWCIQCGKEIDVDQVEKEQNKANVPSYLAQSILVTFFCNPLIIIGFIAIFFSTQVLNRLSHGDIGGAYVASFRARRLVLFSFKFTILLILLFIMMVIVAIILAFIGFAQMLNMLTGIFQDLF